MRLCPLKSVVESDVYLIKTNSDGNLQWQKPVGGNGTEGGLSVQQTIDAGYIITGQTNSFGAEARDVYLIKLCSEGTLTGDLNCDGIVNYEDVGLGKSMGLYARGEIQYFWVYSGTAECTDENTMVKDGTLAFFSALDVPVFGLHDQDVDDDCFPDEGEEPFLCIPVQWMSQRVQLTPPYEPTPMP